jgi:hypothetical protein
MAGIPGGSPAAMKLKKWDSRSHDFIKDVSESENKFQERYRHKPITRIVKKPWDPLSARHRRPIPAYKPIRMPHLDSSRSTTESKPYGVKVVKMAHTLTNETKKWRPNGNDCWFARTGTPAPSVYSARSTRSAAKSSSGNTQKSARTGRSSARSTSRTAQSTTSTSRSRTSEIANEVNWEMSASELWDKKIQLERQLEAVREEQDALMCEQLARAQNISGVRDHHK